MLYRCQVILIKSEFLSMLMLLTLVVTHEDSIPLIFSLCQEFGLASGAKLNMDKTCGIWLGRWNGRT